MTTEPSGPTSATASFTASATDFPTGCCGCAAGCCSAAGTSTWGAPLTTLLSHADSASSPAVAAVAAATRVRIIGSTSWLVEHPAHESAPGSVHTTFQDL